MVRRELLYIISKRMIILISLSLVIAGAIFSIPIITHTRVMFFWLCLLCGIIGGFVSIQQRMKRLSDAELRLLTGSWCQVLLTPIYGGIFAILLYVIFQSQFISSIVFPEFSYPPIPESGVDSQYFVDFVRDTVPKSGPDFMKLMFWCFVAGFSERFVPRLISEIEDKATPDKDDAD